MDSACAAHAWSRPDAGRRSRAAIAAARSRVITRHQRVPGAPLSILSNTRRGAATALSRMNFSIAARSRAPTSCSVKWAGSRPVSQSAPGHASAPWLDRAGGRFDGAADDAAADLSAGQPPSWPHACERSSTGAGVFSNDGRITGWRRTCFRPTGTGAARTGSARGLTDGGFPGRRWRRWRRNGTRGHRRRLRCIRGLRIGGSGLGAGSRDSGTALAPTSAHEHRFRNAAAGGRTAAQRIALIASRITASSGIGPGRIGACGTDIVRFSAADPPVRRQ